jgi:hypothetical protein
MGGVHSIYRGEGRWVVCIAYMEERGGEGRWVVCIAYMVERRGEGRCRQGFGGET